MATCWFLCYWWVCVLMGLRLNDVIKWKYFPRYWPFVRGIHRSPVNSPHKTPATRSFDVLLICAWINGWVNNGEAGDLRCHRAHYDVTVMEMLSWIQHRAVLLWKDETAGNSEPVGLSTSRPLSTIVCLVSVMLYIFQLPTMRVFNDWRVSMMVADGLAPIWHQDISNHRNDIGRLVAASQECSILES